MTDSKKFKREYKISVEGVTVNGAASDYIESTLVAMVDALDKHYKRVSVALEEI